MDFCVFCVFSSTFAFSRPGVRLRWHHPYLGRENYRAEGLPQCFFVFSGTQLFRMPKNPRNPTRKSTNFKILKIRVFISVLLETSFCTQFGIVVWDDAGLKSSSLKSYVEVYRRLLPKNIFWRSGIFFRKNQRIFRKSSSN